MPMKRETGKDRWKRVPKDYFRTRDGLQRTRLRLSALACVLAIGWWAIGVDWTGKGASSTDVNSLRANHGELARVHTAWENRCDACHAPFAPIDGRPLLSSKSVPADQRKSDQLCMSCHAGPAHHKAQVEAEVKGCAECHRDHQGGDFSLVRLKDVECTSCHENMSAHMASGAKPAWGRMFENVSRFAEADKAHPAFRPEAATYAAGKPPVDKGRLKFNHALHMASGIVKDPKATPYTYGQIPIASERERYRKSAAPTAPVQLDCASCHVLDPGDASHPVNPAVATTTPPVRTPGAYYRPITFENNCRACHSLSFDPRMPDVEVPHGVQPDVVESSLRQTYAAQVLSDDPKLLSEVYTPKAPLPGKAPVETPARKKLDDAVAVALKSFFDESPAESGSIRKNNCNECHYFKKDEKAAKGLVEPTKVPEIWFTHAAFDHTAHRGVSCRECHSRSYPLEADGKTPTKDASTVATDVLIPNIDNCVQCHAPSKGWAGWFASSPASSTGGASFDCTECHRYHNGDNPLQGPGARAQDATADRTVAEFLSGIGGGSAPAPEKKADKP